MFLFIVFQNADNATGSSVGSAQAQTSAGDGEPDSVTSTENQSSPTTMDTDEAEGNEVFKHAIPAILTVQFSVSNLFRYSRPLT